MPRLNSTLKLTSIYKCLSTVVQALAAVVALDLHPELRVQVLCKLLPMDYVIEYCPQAMALGEVAAEAQAQGVAMPSAPPPPKQQ